jgi:hypothetical protein
MLELWQKSGGCMLYLMKKYRKKEEKVFWSIDLYRKGHQ